MFGCVPLISKVLLDKVNESPAKLPDILMFPVPFISLLFRLRLPPSCGDVSFTTSVITLSNVGSAPLLALKNLPSLLDVP